MMSALLNLFVKISMPASLVYVTIRKLSALVTIRLRILRLGRTRKGNPLKLSATESVTYQSG